MLESQIYQRPSCQCSPPETAGSDAQGVFFNILGDHSKCRHWRALWTMGVLHCLPGFQLEGSSEREAGKLQAP